MAKDMTDEEYDALDELLTKTTPRLTKVVGPFMRQRQLLDALDIVARNYVITIAEATHKTPTKVIADMIHEKIANANFVGDANEVGDEVCDAVSVKETIAQ